jgi:outer membrane protein W
MRKQTLYTIIFSLICVTMASAQEFKKFKVGIGFGYASASGSGASGGVLAYLEPGYRVNDKIIVNLRMETAVITRGTSDNTGASFDVAAIGSYTVNGQYYFSNNTFRPFAGLGLGAYSLAAVKVDGVSGNAVDAETKFGFYPRVGFDLGHFNLSLDYNLIPNSKVKGGDLEFKNSYLGFRFGFSIGGGKVK